MFAGKSDEVSSGECRHDCVDEESHQKELVESKQVNDDHLGQVVPSPLYKLLAFKVFFGLYGVPASLHHRLGCTTLYWTL